MSVAVDAYSSVCCFLQGTCRIAMVEVDRAHEVDFLPEGFFCVCMGVYVILGQLVHTL